MLRDLQREDEIWCWDKLYGEPYDFDYHCIPQYGDMLNPHTRPEYLPIKPS